MSDDDVTHRLHRIYAAIGAAEERDLSKLRAHIITSGKTTAIEQDFSGGLPPEAFDVLANSMIYNIAHFQYYLERWAHRNGKDKSLVHRAFTESFALQVMRDLSNNDKHGYPPRTPSHSGRTPRLVKPRRIFRLSTGAEEGSWAAMTFATDGTPVMSGPGSGVGIVTGEVVDDQAVVIGDLYDLANQALAAWKDLLSEYGVQI